MKTLFRVTIAVILTLTLANTNCVGVPNAVGDATAQAGNATAAQLAAALDALNEGSARVSGNTVTLTRGIGLQRNLTVPVGVTLELAGDGGLWLRDNITLTVNGTNQEFLTEDTEG